ncbi:MAG: hypothetical protein EA376_01270 [Phycisphaeraceae bacterium]|nr:MAG: hypothetical protein EA376_01270 [Phycisphaeraceae bacterium]
MTQGSRHAERNGAAAEERRGVVCPSCGCAHLPVQYTRRRSGFIMRVRQCRHCGRRIVTRER